jgi:hypothetical protein
MCHECGGPLGANPKLAIFAVGFSGHRSACTLCAACWENAQRLGGPGPNVSAQSRIDAAAAKAKKDNRPLRQLG